MDVEPKWSNSLFDGLWCELKFTGAGVHFNVWVKRLRAVDVGSKGWIDLVLSKPCFVEDDLFFLVKLSIRLLVFTWVYGFKQKLWQWRLDVFYWFLCGSFKGALRWAGPNGSDKRTCLSSKVYGFYYVWFSSKYLRLSWLNWGSRGCQGFWFGFCDGLVDRESVVDSC